MAWLGFYEALNSQLICTIGYNTSIYTRACQLTLICSSKLAYPPFNSFRDYKLGQLLVAEYTPLFRTNYYGKIYTQLGQNNLFVAPCIRLVLLNAKYTPLQFTFSDIVLTISTRIPFMFRFTTFTMQLFYNDPSIFNIMYHLSVRSGNTNSW